MPDSVEKLLAEIDDFVLDLDSEYYNDIEQIILGKISSLRSHLKALGYFDLVSEIDEVQSHDEKIIRLLEILRGYVIPEVRQRFLRQEEDTSYTSFWSQLHPRIRAVSQSRFDAGHYADAVEASLKELNNKIKIYYQQIGGNELDGAKLMNQAFSVNEPTIPLADLSTETGKSIQQGYMQIFAGTMTGIRNPAAHANLQIEQGRAVHYLYLASLLLYVFAQYRTKA